MEDKESYSHEELKEMMLAYKSYFDQKLYEVYIDKRRGLLTGTCKTNQKVEECEKKLPKSLIDKLGIKKIE